MTKEELKLARARKIIESGDVQLAQLAESILINENLATLNSKEIVIPETIIPEVIIPEYKEVVFPDVQKVEVINQAPVVKVDAPIVNLPAPIVNVEAPIIEINNEEVVAELKNISDILSKEEVESVDKTEIVNAKGETVDIEKLLKNIADRVSNIHISGGGSSFPTQSQMDLSSLVAKYSLRVDKTSESGIIYIGNAVIGSSESVAVWQISKVDTSVLSLKWAGGSSAFGHVWDDRVSLTYL